MRVVKETKSTKWNNIILFYAIACGLTYLSLLLPNLIGFLSLKIFDFEPPFNWNHGIALLVVSVLAYKFFKLPKKTTLLGKKPIRSIAFSLVFLLTYLIVGISNKYGINHYLWAFVFCSSTLLYNVCEESAWRGVLNDALNSNAFWFKTIIIGVMWSVWHLLIWDNFNSWGGFHFYVILSVLVSFLIGYAALKTGSILVATSVHALLINKDINVTVFCLLVWLIMILTWDYKKLKLPKLISQANQ